jgi:CHAT domain-containing protein
VYPAAFVRGEGAQQVGEKGAVDLLLTSSLAKQTESFRRQLARRDLGFRDPARQLYRLLLRPAHAQIQGKTNLIIAPDDKLWESPFQALVAEGGRYLIETSAISYAHSLTVLREMRAQQNKRRPE